MKQEDRFYLAALLGCPGIGYQTMKRILRAEPSVSKLWQMNADDFVGQKLLNESLAQKLVSWRQENADFAEKLSAQCEESRIQLCTVLDEGYPPLLQEIAATPVLFYYKGTLQPHAERIAMVGARRNTAYGESIAKSFAEFLARAGLTIVSGAARGIDTCAHLGALKGGRTVAVLGCGLDIVYPPENLRLLQTIVATGGAVISEYVPGTSPYSGNFPARNRIISGLSRGTLVVEAAKHSGSLITAHMAGDTNREVYAIPGSIYSQKSSGCNELIQKNEAQLVQKVEDILNDLRENGLLVPRVPQVPMPKKQKELHLSPEEQQVYDVLSFQEDKTADEILIKLENFNYSQLSAILTQLELKKLITKNDSCAYRRTEGE